MQKNKINFISLVTGVVAVVSVLSGGTYAYFSDSEISSGNSFTAGTLDLAVEYNDGVRSCVINGDLTPSGCLPAINFSNVVPGASGTAATFGLHNTGSTPATFVSFYVPDPPTYIGTCTEPEVNDVADSSVDDCYHAVIGTPEDNVLSNNNELPGKVNLTLKQGTTTVWQGTLDQFLSVSSTNPIEITTSIGPGQTAPFSLEYAVASGTGNEIQDDGVSFNLKVNLFQ